MAQRDFLLRFGSALKSLRNELGISQEELAGRANLHRTYISDIERGARNVSLESIQKLARGMNVPASALFPETDQAGSMGRALRAPGLPDPLVDILLVEDNPRDVELTLEAFARARVSNAIHVARDGEEALDFVFCEGAYAARQMSHRLQLILLDLHLPKVSGLEVLRQLKEDVRTRSIPVVVVTESERNRDMEECRQLGVESYIVKPVDFQRFSQVTPRLSFQWALLKPGARMAKSIHPLAPKG